MRIRTRNNRTKQYLFPCVNTFGTTFLKELNNLTNYTTGYPITQSVLSVSVSDYLWYRAKGIDLTEIKDKPYLFIVFDTRGCYNEDKDLYLNLSEGKKRFGLFLQYVRKNKHYVSDYWFDTNKHCVILEIERFRDAYDYFFSSVYSKMYSKEELKELKFTKTMTQKGDTYMVNEYAVLTKEPKVGSIYLKKVIYESFGVEHLPDEPKEFDIPWFIEDEILNTKYMTPLEFLTLKEAKSASTILQS
jgi:hypothetical protein